MPRPNIPHVEGSGRACIAINSGPLRPLLANTEPTPPGVNISIELSPKFAAYRLAALSKASPIGLFKPLLANTELVPPGVNLSMYPSKFVCYIEIARRVKD